MQHFIHCVGIYPVGTLVRLASGRLAVVIEAGDRELLRPKVRAVYDTEQARSITPVDIDLSEHDGEAHDDHIAGFETGDDWDIDPLAFMTPS